MNSLKMCPVDWLGRWRCFRVNYEEHKNREGNFQQIEDYERDGKDSRYSATFRYISVFKKIHLKVSVRLDSDVVVDFSKQSFLPEEISVKNPEA